MRRGNGVTITRATFRGMKRGVVFDHDAAGRRQRRHPDVGQRL